MILLILRIFFTFSHLANSIYPSKLREYIIIQGLSPPLTYFYLVYPLNSFLFSMTLSVVTSSLCFLIPLLLPLTLQDITASEPGSHGESI